MVMTITLVGWQRGLPTALGWQLKSCKIELGRRLNRTNRVYFCFMQFINHHLEIIHNAGHSIIRENPELFLKNIRQFLNE